MHEMQVQSLGQEDTLVKGMETHSSILAGRIPWTEGAGRLQSMWSQRVGHDCTQHSNSYLMRYALYLHTALSNSMAYLWTDSPGAQPLIIGPPVRFSFLTHKT